MSAESADSVAMGPPEVPAKENMTSKDIEHLEEAKLKAKFPMAANRPAHSAFLQKRLLKGQKYFDSGDYQMAKQSTQPSNLAKPRPPPFIPIQTGEEIPTPESVPARKTSIIQPSHKFPHP
ncbi:cAMP-regulated phosphoprotein 19 isoform X2 [Thrips palmi]|uniref:cAMP-regulated phosphoprotein 19 isoform X2 n=1 Tax=Thrips palmi TaxID=161013 RepID=A0A6P8Z4L3_THRPL|nr:cAMP-regulated phosphoprotein 19 isoform X2 [Thrips palmi]